MKIKKITHLIFHELPLQPFFRLANFILFDYVIIGQQIYTVFYVFHIISGIS